jgi:hypothetical protein
VATFQATEGDSPLWISAGLGTKRFRNGFVNASAQVAQPLRLWAEYDGLDPNFGVLLTFRSTAARPVEVNLLVGIVKKYPTVALGLGF